jgi:hypothetical protein
MPLFIVMVTTNLNYRYVDSYWSSSSNAARRCEDLKSSLKASGIASWSVWIANARIEDARLGKAPKS